MSKLVFINKATITKESLDVIVEALCEIEIGGEADMTLVNSFSARCEIAINGYANLEFAGDIVAELEIDGSANISIDGSPDTFLEAYGEIEIDGEANLGQTVHLEARAFIEIDGSADLHVAEADSYLIQVIVDVVDFGNPFID